MKLTRRVVAGMCLIAMGCAWSAEPSGKTTLDNLQTSYNGESNAQAKYEAFAAKADEEGYKSVATLFRAAALSESIHAKKQAAAIKKLGGDPKAAVEKPTVKSTKENLESALAGETYEAETMYPAFLKQAQAEKRKAAVIPFKGAQATEAGHVKLYKQALAELDAWKASGKAFMVCQICGYTQFNDPALAKCPICAAPKEKFTVVK